MAKKKVVKGLWSKSEINLLKKLFPSNPTVKIAARLGRSFKSAEMKAFKMGLKKSKKHLKSLGRA